MGSNKLIELLDLEQPQPTYILNPAQPTVYGATLTVGIHLINVQLQSILQFLFWCEYKIYLKYI